MSHVWRPVFVVLAIVAVLFGVRAFIVPPDFGIWESGYMYGWYRKSNELFWKDVFPVNHKGHQYCADCHPEKVRSVLASVHKNVECEDCHGPAFDHPQEPAKLSVDRGRPLCLRCHALLPYPTSLRSELRGLENPAEHYPDAECSACHDPHAPGVPGEEAKTGAD